MAKRNNDMEMNVVHQDLTTLKRQMGEVLLILGGSASYDYKGMRSDVRELKTNVSNIQAEIEQIKRENEEKEKEKGVISIKLSTMPAKIAAFITVLGTILAIVQSIVLLFNPEQ